MTNEYRIGAELGQLKVEIEKYKDALERRDDFIRWLIEVKYQDSYDSISELWDEFEKYEDAQFEQDEYNDLMTERLTNNQKQE